MFRTNKPVVISAPRSGLNLFRYTFETLTGLATPGIKRIHEGPPFGFYRTHTRKAGLPMYRAAEEPGGVADCKFNPLDHDGKPLYGKALWIIRHPHAYLERDGVGNRRATADYFARLATTAKAFGPDLLIMHYEDMNNDLRVAVRAIESLGFSPRQHSDEDLKNIRTRSLESYEVNRSQYKYVKRPGPEKTLEAVKGRLEAAGCGDMYGDCFARYA